MNDDALTPERAQGIAREVLAELTSGRRRSPDAGDGHAAAEAIVKERFPQLTEYDRTAVLFRINRMLSARATRAARARAGHEGGVAAAAAMPDELPQGDMVIAEAIAARRQQMGLSLDDLASRIGVAPARMRNFELGNRRVPVALLARVAQVLEVDLGWFSRDRSADETAPPAPVQQAAGAPAAAPAQPTADERRVDEPGPDDLYALYASLPAGMRRAVVGIMREMVAERARAATEKDRRTA